ncbi:hypothetical protein [Flavobacterium sp.]|uniref:hypothetical protein n=1 Tax=Flavobacterium sp. TaxID=239 RepID=UPI00261420A2|nr:hypothetical protein [Flavobacterium sp.]
MTLKLFFTAMLVSLLNLTSFAQEMPLKLGKLPDNIKYELKGSTNKVFETKKTEFYSFSIGKKNGGFIKISTNGIDDVIMILSKSQEGGDLYRKLKDESYVRIIHCLKKDNEFEIFLIDEKNIPIKLTTTKSETSLDALMVGYGLYWSKNKPN